MAHCAPYDHKYIGKKVSWLLTYYVLMLYARHQLFHFTLFSYSPSASGKNRMKMKWVKPTAHIQTHRCHRHHHHHRNSHINPSNVWRVLASVNASSSHWLPRFDLRPLSSYVIRRWRMAESIMRQSRSTCIFYSLSIDFKSLNVIFRIM